MANLKKQSGGPKTEEGKLQSSKNATKHGLTSTQPSGEDEKALVEAYSKELIDFYAPKSPLELLQIQRIAICRAKLSYLYELEKIKLSLARKELEGQPEKVLEKIPGALGVSKAMALELIQQGDITLPCDLTPALLSIICEEIAAFHGQIDNEHQFSRTFPKLTKYLNTMTGSSSSDGWLGKLAQIAGRLEKVLGSGENYYGMTEKLFHYYSLGMKYEKVLEHEAMRPKIEELQRYQDEVVRPRHGLKPRKKEPDDLTKVPEHPSPETIAKQLGTFVVLKKDFVAAQKLFTQYQEVQALVLRSISLPVAESDLLMRYQTTLERRLSSAIGELLELQKRSAARGG
jgi:hypothetical protein